MEIRQRLKLPSVSVRVELPTPADCIVLPSTRAIRSAKTAPTTQTQTADSNKTSVTVELPRAQLASLRPTRPLRHGRHQKTTQIWFCYRGIGTSSQNQRQKLHRHRELHLRFALAPPLNPLSTYPPGGEGSCWRIQTFSLLRWGGEWFGSMSKSTLFFSDYPGERSSLPFCHMQSISGFSPEKDCIGNWPWKIRESWG